MLTLSSREFSFYDKILCFRNKNTGHSIIYFRKDRKEKGCRIFVYRRGNGHRHCY